MIVEGCGMWMRRKERDWRFWRNKILGLICIWMGVEVRDGRWMKFEKRGWNGFRGFKIGRVGNG
ncbi:hypothetical protein, partial [Bacillus altitudinis]|uniref:hypothetical protein n=1 Tax=Bacillus altitudinis TaxID=293387 RepID=UPI001C92E684